MLKKQSRLFATLLLSGVVAGNIGFAQSGLQYAIISDSYGNIVGQLAGNGLSLDATGISTIGPALSSYVVWQPVTGIYANDIGANSKGIVWIISNTPRRLEDMPSIDYQVMRGQKLKEVPFELQWIRREMPG